MKRIIKIGFLTCFMLMSAGKNACGQEVNDVNSVTQDVADTLDVKETASKNEIAIVGFKRLENDITARVKAPKRDQNGDLCAIIKVVTKDKNLFFEPDALGITAREDQPGEIWLYVPHGAKRITIKHERFGVIRNYFYEEPIDKTTVYELLLYVPEVKAERVVIREEVRATEQSLMMNYSPANAKIYIDDVLQRTNDNGAFTVILPLGMHNYRVESSYHKVEKGSFEIVPERLTALNVALRPEFGLIRVNSNKEKTHVFLDDKQVGEAPFNSDTLAIGKHHIRVERLWHVPQEKEIEVTVGERQQYDFNLKRQKPNVFLLPQMGSALGDHNQTSFGVFAGICRKGGGYISVRTNGKFQLENVSSIVNQGFNGKSQKSHIAGSLGFMAYLMKYLYLYGGCGYTARGLWWESADGSSVTKIVRAVGPMVEGGLIGRYKKIAISIGYANTFIGFNYLLKKNTYGELTFGIGYVFGR